MRRGEFYYEQLISVYHLLSVLGAFQSGFEPKGLALPLALCSPGELTLFPWIALIIFTFPLCLSWTYAFCSTNLIPNHSLKSQINQWREVQVWQLANYCTLLCQVSAWFCYRLELGVHSLPLNLSTSLPITISSLKGFGIHLWFIRVLPTRWHKSVMLSLCCLHSASMLFFQVWLPSVQKLSMNLQSKMLYFVQLDYGERVRNNLSLEVSTSTRHFSMYTRATSSLLCGE